MTMTTDDPRLKPSGMIQLVLYLNNPEKRPLPGGLDAFLKALPPDSAKVARSLIADADAGTLEFEDLAAQLEARVSEIENHYDNYGEEPEDDHP